MKNQILTWTIVLSLALVLSACEDVTGVEGNGDVVTITGRLTKTGVFDGTDFYVTVVAAGDDWNATSLYSTSGTFQDQVADYEIAEVVPGTYNVFALIDVNDNATSGSPGPDAGDWVAAAENVTIDGNQQIDADNDEWELWDDSDGSAGTGTVRLTYEGDMSATSMQPIVVEVYADALDIPAREPIAHGSITSSDPPGSVEIDVPANTDLLLIYYHDIGEAGLSPGDPLGELIPFEVAADETVQETLYCWSNSIGVHGLGTMDDLNNVVHISYSYTGATAVGDEDAWMNFVLLDGPDPDSGIIYLANMGPPENERALVGFGSAAIYVVFWLDVDHDETPSSGDSMTEPQQITPVPLDEYSGPEEIVFGDEDLDFVMGEIIEN
jgi:hypothetical protein